MFTVMWTWLKLLDMIRNAEKSKTDSEKIVLKVLYRDSPLRWSELLKRTKMSFQNLEKNSEQTRI